MYMLSVHIYIKIAQDKKYTQITYFKYIIWFFFKATIFTPYLSLNIIYSPNNIQIVNFKYPFTGSSKKTHL